MKRRKLHIENLDKILGKKLGHDYYVANVSTMMHWIIIFVNDINSKATFEVKIKRESDNTMKPYRWTMQYGSLNSPMYKKDFETPENFLVHLEDLITPLPF